MLLALAYQDYNDELRADFQETYNLNIDSIGVTYSVHHAASLCSQLPTSSRLLRAIHPENEFDLSTQLLAWIEYNQRILAASLGDHTEYELKAMRPALPEELLPAEMHKKKTVSMSIEEFDEFRQRKRKGVTHE